MNTPVSTTNVRPSTPKNAPTGGVPEGRFSEFMVEASKDSMGGWGVTGPARDAGPVSTQS